MATIPQAVEAIIQATGLPRANVESRARRLRDNGLLPKGKRGGGRFAAHLSADHLAVLLISMIATPSHRKAHKVTSRLMDLNFSVIYRQEGLGEKLTSAVQKSFTDATGDKNWLPPKFGKAVSKLIELAGQDETRKLIDHYMDGLEVNLIEERPRAAIVVKDPNQPVIEITNPEGKSVFSDKLKIADVKAYLYFGENMKETAEWIKENFERPTRFEMKASIGAGIFATLADLLKDDEETKTE